jgi:hypothetical protein
MKNIKRGADKPCEQGYTAGPWKVEPFKLGDRLEADCGVYSERFEGQAISICRAPRYEKEKQWEANAALIAAAPDLLDSLKYMIREAKTSTDWSGPLSQQIIRQMDELISKAEVV